MLTFADLHNQMAVSLKLIAQVIALLGCACLSLDSREFPTHKESRCPIAVSSIAWLTVLEVLQIPWVTSVVIDSIVL